eukprot:388892_1
MAPSTRGSSILTGSTVTESTRIAMVRPTRASGAWKCRRDMALSDSLTVPSLRGSSTMAIRAEEASSPGTRVVATRAISTPTICTVRAPTNGATAERIRGSGKGTTWVREA